MNADEYRETHEISLLQTDNQCEGSLFSTAIQSKTVTEWLQDKSVNVIERSKEKD